MNCATLEERNFIEAKNNDNFDEIFSFFPELLVSMPLTVFLPSLVLRRSLMLEEEEEMLSPTPSSNSSTSLSTTSLERIFETLGIDSLECQKRFICEAMETPKRFEPLSNIIYILLRWKSICRKKFRSDKKNWILEDCLNLSLYRRSGVDFTNTLWAVFFLWQCFTVLQNFSLDTVCLSIFVKEYWQNSSM